MNEELTQQQAALAKAAGQLDGLRIERDAIERQKLDGLNLIKDLEAQVVKLSDEIYELTIEKRELEQKKLESLVEREEELQLNERKMASKERSLIDWSEAIRSSEEKELKNKKENEHRSKDLEDREKSLGKQLNEFNTRELLLSQREKEVEKAERSNLLVDERLKKSFELLNKEEKRLQAKDLGVVNEKVQLEAYEKSLNRQAATLADQKIELTETRAAFLEEVKQFNISKAELDAKFRLLEDEKLTVAKEKQSVTEDLKALESKELELSLQQKDLERRERNIKIKEEIAR